MASKTRRDTKGRALRKGESYNATKELYCFAYTDTWGKRKYIYSKDLIVLREKEKEYLRDKLDGIDLYVKNQADINSVFDRYISTKTELRSTTKTGYIYNYDRFVRKGFGRKKICEVKYSDVLLFYKGLLDKGYSLSIIDGIHCVLHPTFQMAVRDNVIRNNPTDGVIAEIRKKFTVRPEPRHALSPEEQKAFFDYLEQDEYRRWKPLFTVMFGTGCRIGELIGLTWDDVDFTNNVISINHSISYNPRFDNDYKVSYEVHLPKTQSGIRTIPMLEPVREALIEEKEYQEESGNFNIMEIDGLSGFVFANRFGLIHKPSGINKRIKDIVSDHNAAELVKARREHREPVIIPNFSCHIARHTFCTRLCENETNVKLIQQVMGHKDIQTTLDIYAEISESKQKEAFIKLNGANIV